jgi:hypothetical protein
MRLPPLAVIASWPTPNYIDPTRRGWANLITNAVLYPLVCVALFIRVFTRLRISRSFGVDDWLILVAIVSLTSTKSCDGDAYSVSSLQQRSWL